MKQFLLLFIGLAILGCEDDDGCIDEVNFTDHNEEAVTYPFNKEIESTFDDLLYDILNDNIEWDAGIVFGSRLTKSLGMFVEGTHQRYWMKPVYEIKFGFNYLIF